MEEDISEIVCSTSVLPMTRLWLPQLEQISTEDTLEMVDSTSVPPMMAAMASSAGPYFNGGYFGNSQFDDSDYEKEYDVVCAVHSASTSTISSQSANTVICKVLGLGHKMFISMEDIVESPWLMKPG